MNHRSKLALGAYLNTPAMQRRRAEARALMHLSLLEHGARMGYRRPDDLPAQLRAIAIEFTVIGPTIARQVQAA